MIGRSKYIITINAKSLFKYFPKKKNEQAESFCFDTRKRTLYTLVVKAENELEECPMLHQFLEVLKEELGDKFDGTDEYLLHDKFLIMDFEDIFMPIDENASGMCTRICGVPAHIQYLFQSYWANLKHGDFYRTS